MFAERDFESELSEARAALRKAREDSGAETVAEQHAEAAEGRLRVTIDESGRVGAIELDPRLLREGSEYLAAELRTAINTALGQRDETLGGNEHVPDMGAMDATIQRLQDSGIRQMKTISAAVTETMNKIHKG